METKLPYDRGEREAVIQAIQDFDLPGYIAQQHPGSLVANGRSSYKGVRCKWRGEDRNPSGSLSYKNGKWLWHDFARQEGGDALDFLMGAEGRRASEAWEILLNRRVVEPAVRKHIAPRPKRSLNEPSLGIQKQLAMGQQALIQQGLPSTWDKRGLNQEDATLYKLGRQGNSTLIAVTRPDGGVGAVKIRWSPEILGAREKEFEEGKRKSKPGRFEYAETGYDNPCWFSPDWAKVVQQGKGILLVEGEGKAISLHNALRYAAAEDRYAVVGVPGTEAKLPLGHLTLPVYIIPDTGLAGSRAAFGYSDRRGGHRPGWKDILEEANIPVMVLPPVGDMCDVAQGWVERWGHVEGNTKLGQEIVRLIQLGNAGLDARSKAEEIVAKGLRPSAFPRKSGNNEMAATMAILRRVMQGNFVPSEAGPIVTISQNDFATFVGSDSAKQGQRVRQYLIESGVITPTEDLPQLQGQGLDKLAQLQHDLNTARALRKPRQGQANALCPDYVPVRGFVLNIPLLQSFTNSQGRSNNTDRDGDSTPSTPEQADPTSLPEAPQFKVKVDFTRSQKACYAPITIRGQHVIEFIRQKGSTTRKEIAAYLGTSLSAVATILSRLHLYEIINDTVGQIKLTPHWAERLAGYSKSFGKAIKDRVTALWENVRLRYQQATKRPWWKQPLKLLRTTGSPGSTKGRSGPTFKPHPMSSPAYS